MSRDSGQLRKTLLYRALHRPNLFMGGERELVMTAALLSAGLILPSMNFVALLIGALVWLVALWSLRAMAKIDPELSVVYRRQLRFRSYYPAGSTPWRKE